MSNCPKKLTIISLLDLCCDSWSIHSWRLKVVNFWKIEFVTSPMWLMCQQFIFCCESSTEKLIKIREPYSDLFMYLCFHKAEGLWQCSYAQIPQISRVHNYQQFVCYWFVVSFSHSGSNQLEIGRKLPFTVSFSDRRQIYDSDGAGIVSCGKRLSISLVFHWLKQRSNSSVYSKCVCVIGMVNGGARECTLMTDHFMPPLLWPPECEDVFLCALIWLIVFLFLSCHSPFFRAAYQLTMATNRAILTAAGLMSVGTAHCQPIIINLVSTQSGNGTISKKNLWPSFTPLQVVGDTNTKKR